MSRPTSNNRINRQHLTEDMLNHFKVNGIKLVSSRSKSPELAPNVAVIAVDSVVNSIKVNLMRGNQVELRGLGTFKVKEYSQRNKHNPKTLERVKVPTKNRVRFTESEVFNKSIN